MFAAAFLQCSLVWSVDVNNSEQLYNIQSCVVATAMFYLNNNNTF